MPPLSLQTIKQQIKLPAFLDEVITLETLDKHLELFPCERIHLLKVDVEGFEMNVFRGGRNSLNSTYIDFIQFEFGNGMLQTSTSFLDFMEMFHKNYYFLFCFE